MRWSHVQPRQSTHRYFSLLSRVVRVNTPTLRVWEKKRENQNNKELWRNTLTTLDTSSREEVPAYLSLAAINLPEVVKASERAKKRILKVVTAI